MTTRRQLSKRVGTLINQVGYKPDWFLQYGFDDERIYLQVTIPALDAATRKRVVLTGRKWHLSPFMTDSEIVSTAFKAFATAEEHECREHFVYRGRAVFGPHLNVNDLVDALDAGSVRLDVRP